MPEAYSVAEMAREIGTIKVELSALRTTQALNHAQNRNDIHSIRGVLQSVVDKITSLQITNARWSIGGGVATAIIVKLLDHLIKG